MSTPQLVKITTSEQQDMREEYGENFDYRAEFNDGQVIVARRRSKRIPFREQIAAARIYGALDALVPSLLKEEPYQGQIIPLNPTKPEDIKAAKEWTAWKRKTTKAGREALLPYLELLADKELDPKTVRFSQNAGCSCGCSPGFIAKDRGLGFLDLWFEEQKTTN
jgi:hypothetical protein